MTYTSFQVIRERRKRCVGGEGLFGVDMFVGHTDTNIQFAGGQERGSDVVLIRLKILEQWRFEVDANRVEPFLFERVDAEFRIKLEEVFAYPRAKIK